jgi:hypothetical protein
MACVESVMPAPLPPPREELGDLHGVEGGALAQVVVADEQREPAPVGHPGVLAQPADEARVLTGRLERVGHVAQGHAGRGGQQLVACATDSGRANSTFSDSEWPVSTGTRTQVPDTSRSGMPRILRLSLRSFCSSSVSKEPSSSTEPASGTTLKAIGATYFSGAGKSTAEPSWTSSVARSTTWRTCLSSSSTPARPLPDTAW